MRPIDCLTLASQRQHRIGTTICSFKMRPVSSSVDRVTIMTRKRLSRARSANSCRAIATEALVACVAVYSIDVAIRGPCDFSAATRLSAARPLSRKTKRTDRMRLRVVRLASHAVRAALRCIYYAFAEAKDGLDLVEKGSGKITYLHG